MGGYSRRKKRKRRSKRKTGKKTLRKSINKKVVIYGITGMLLLVMSMVYYIISDNMGDFRIPLGVMYATNRPNQELWVGMYMNEKEGEIFLGFNWVRNGKIAMEEYDDVVFWVRILDVSEFEWKCSGDIVEVVAEQVGGNAFLVKGTGNREGHGNEAVFGIKYERNRNRWNSIQIKREKKEFRDIKDGICQLRIPSIVPWFGLSYDQEGLSYEQENILKNGKDIFSDIRLADKVFNGENLYLPAVNYSAYVADASLFDDNLELYSVSPEAQNDGLFLRWGGYNFFTPEVRYRLRNDGAIGACKENICFVLFGMGLSLLYGCIKAKEAQ